MILARLLSQLSVMQINVIFTLTDASLFYVFIHCHMVTTCNSCSKQLYNYSEVILH